jgi:hypothetical protein
MIKVFFADSDTVGSRLVRSITKGKWSHCGFYDPDTKTVIDSLASVGGVTEYHIDHLRSYFPRTEILSLRAFPHAVLASARGEIGKPYDYRALLGFLPLTRKLSRNWQDPTRWYCSELVAACADRHFISPLFPSSVQAISPQDLYEKLQPLSEEFLWSPR